MKKPLTLVLLFLLSLSFSGCKKKVEAALDDAIVNAMVNGQWVITSFKQNGTDMTSEFSVYKFQYHSDKTVDAIKNGTIENSGTWDGSALNKTTWANFPGNSLPITLLNGTWKITNNTWTYVVASQTNGAETKIFRLDKQ